MVGTRWNTAGVGPRDGVMFLDLDAVVAEQIVATATDRKPKPQYTAGSIARRGRALRRIARTFDQ
ncbi:hypothetical protein AB0H00_22825 [Nocardia sp. NPDC023852]|uniref:hypothetical protein n=1 Tax=Nocardia sp. NPDC023852 TaxID=3154697 RepID=UPI0033C45C1F